MAPSLVDWKAILSTQRNCRQFCLLLNKYTSQKKTNSWISQICCLLCKHLKTDHPLLIQIQELLHKINANKKETIFMWVLGHIDSQGNKAAVRATKEAEPTTGLIPFSDLRPLTSKYVCEVWQKEWDEAGLVSNKFHEILPKLPGKLLSFCNTRKENTVLNRLHIGQSYLTHLFILKKEKVPVCVMCNTVLTIKHILIECVELLEVRKKYLEQKSLYSLFWNVSPK